MSKIMKPSCFNCQFLVKSVEVPIQQFEERYKELKMYVVPKVGYRCKSNIDQELFCNNLIDSITHNSCYGCLFYTEGEKE